jgi:hypothetical protein
LSTPIAVVGEELRSVFAALEQAVPLIEVLSSPFSSKDADDIDRAVDDAKRFRMLAADLREHAGRATLAAECVEEAARGVEALRAKVTEREKLKTLGIDLDPVIRLCGQRRSSGRSGARTCTTKWGSCLLFPRRVDREHPLPGRIRTARTRRRYSCRLGRIARICRRWSAPMFQPSTAASCCEPPLWN